MFTLVMMTALSGSPDAVQFGGKSKGCDGGGGGVLGGLFHRGGKGAKQSAGCCGPVVTAAPCCGSGVAVPAVPCCGGGAAVVAPAVATPAGPAPTAMPSATPAPAAMPDKPAVAPAKPATPPGGTF